MLRPLEKSIWSCELFGGPELEKDFTDRLATSQALLERDRGTQAKGVLLFRNRDNAMLAFAESPIAGTNKAYIDGIYAIVTNLIQSDIFRPPPTSFQLHGTQSRLLFERGSWLSLIGVFENPSAEARPEWTTYVTDMLIDRTRYKCIFEARLEDIPQTADLKSELVGRFASEFELTKTLGPSLRILLSSIEKRFAAVLGNPSKDSSKLTGVEGLLRDFLKRANEAIGPE